jgi:hypothetical protein
MAIKSLDKVGYISQSPKSAQDLLGNTIKVYDTMAYNLNSKTAPSTALSWATSPGSYINGKWVVNTVIPKPEELPNNPFKIKIIGLDIRSQGGRAYKVIDIKNRRFDLREDQVFEIIANCGIEKGGVIPLPVVWAVLGSQIRIILVGGKLYSEMNND